jgi:TolB-like protein
MKTKYFLISILVLVLIVAGYFLIPKLFNRAKPVENSIAVLPFRDDSLDESNTYFINGITSETIYSLAMIRDLKVIGYKSVEPFMNSTMSIPEIGKELNVNYILEGSGQKIGDSLRLSVQLINTISGTHLWAKTYNYELKEPGDISKITQDISSELKEIIIPN